MMTKVIFLDCDGVLANSRSLAWKNGDKDENTDTSSIDLIIDPTHQNRPLEKECVLQLARIIEETGADGVVLSTMWRHYPQKRSFLVQSLEAHKIPVVGDTPGGPGRGAEIQAYLQQQTTPLRTFCILDDQHEASFQSVGLIEHVVQTILCNEESPGEGEGLTKEKADQAIALLGRVQERQSSETKTESTQYLPTDSSPSAKQDHPRKRRSSIVRYLSKMKLWNA